MLRANIDALSDVFFNVLLSVYSPLQVNCPIKKIFMTLIMKDLYLSFVPKCFAPCFVVYFSLLVGCDKLLTCELR